MVNVGCSFHNYPVSPWNGAGVGLTMKERKAGMHIPEEELGNGMSEPTSYTGGLVRQWHSGKSSRRLQAEAGLPRGTLCLVNTLWFVKGTESRGASMA